MMWGGGGLCGIGGGGGVNEGFWGVCVLLEGFWRGPVW